MVAGQAGGTAAAYAINNDVTFRQMSRDPEAIRWLQEQLVRQGAYIVEYTPPRMAVMDHWAYPGLVIVRELGMTEGGYNNDYRLENDVASRWPLQNRFNRLMRVVHERTASRGEKQIPSWEIELYHDEITVGDMFLVIAQGASLADNEWMASQWGTDDIQAIVFPDPGAARDYLIRFGILDDDVLRYFPDMDVIASHGQLLHVLGALYTTLMG